MTTEANGPAPTPSEDSSFREMIHRIMLESDAPLGGTWGDALDTLQNIRDEVDSAYRYADARWADEDDD